LDSLEWSRKYEVSSISRVFLRDQLGFTTEQISSLTEEDMDRIAEYVEQFYRGMSRFEDHVGFITRIVLEEKLSGDQND
jgi:hypothetical protein